MGFQCLVLVGILLGQINADVDIGKLKPFIILRLMKATGSRDLKKISFGLRDRFYPRIFLQYDKIILQRTRTIVGDAGFEPPGPQSNVQILPIFAAF